MIKRAERKGTATAWLIDSLLRGGRPLAGVKTTDDDGKRRKDYERLPQMSKSFVYHAMTALMLQRLVP